MKFGGFFPSSVPLSFEKEITAKLIQTTEGRYVMIQHVFLPKLQPLQLSG